MLNVALTSDVAGNYTHCCHVVAGRSVSYFCYFRCSFVFLVTICHLGSSDNL